MTVDLLVLESFPLHTEEPRWAAHAPAQVRAACERGAHIIGLTETRGTTMDECKQIAKAHGYKWFQANMDAHRNVSLLVKKGLKVLHHDDVVVFNNHRVSVTVNFNGSKVTVYQMHWETTLHGHIEQSKSLIAAMEKTSTGKGLSFYMGDSNPHPRPQSDPDSQPNKIMREAGMPVIYHELHDYPANVGVNVIGRNLKDTRVTPKRATGHAALGSDHIPVTAVYAIKRAAAKKTAAKKTAKKAAAKPAAEASTPA